MYFLKKIITSSIQLFFRIVPAGTPEFMYTRVLKPKPLRKITNYFLTFILPEKISTKIGTIYLNPSDPVISGALTIGAFEQCETQLLEEVLTPGMTVLDIGANIGYYTLLAAQKVTGKGKVISFEPEPTNFSFLKKNIEANTLSHVVPVQIALSDNEGSLTLHLCEDNKGRHSLVDYQNTHESITVKTITLDAFLKNNSIVRVDVIKMDVEGAEGLVLEGMTQTLKHQSPIMFIEFFPLAIRASGKDPLIFLSRLSQFGFTIFEIDEAREKVIKVEDLVAFINKYQLEKPANILCRKIV